MSPYRTAEERPYSDEPPDCPDLELLPAFFVLWIASVARVWAAHHQREVFGTEATLAVVVVLLLPVASKDAATWWLRQCLRRLARTWSGAERLP